MVLAIPSGFHAATASLSRDRSCLNPSIPALAKPRQGGVVPHLRQRRPSHRWATLPILDCLIFFNRSNFSLRLICRNLRCRPTSDFLLIYYILSTDRIPSAKLTAQRDSDSRSAAALRHPLRHHTTVLCRHLTSNSVPYRCFPRS